MHSLPSGPPVATPPSLRTLFFRFMEVGLSGFGGVLPFARRMLVEQRAWLTEHEFAEMLSLGQFLPGPNIVNVAVMVGRKFHGVRGSFAAVGGLMLMPMAIVMTLGALYAQFAELAVVRNTMGGVAAAASGLVLAMGFKMARAIRTRPVAIGVAAVAFAAIAFARLPLIWVLGVMAPVAVALAWWKRL
ncbi:MAG: chromate transporter [Proteobacteria bacterium]|nr:chromate transporter [Pseudomonadota bacterium]